MKHEAQSFVVEARSKWDALIKDHYDAHPFEWPTHATERVWHIKSAKTGNNVILTAKTTQELQEKILALQPLRIKYSCNSKDRPSHYFETPFFTPSPQHAVLAAGILASDFGLKRNHLMVIDDGHSDAVVVIACGGPMADTTTAHVRRFHDYLSSEQFKAPVGRATTPNAKRYWERFQRLLADWQQMNPTQLRMHLEAKTPLGNEATSVIEFLRTTENAVLHVEAHPALYAYLDVQAKAVSFPEPNLTKALEGPTVPLVGSYDGVTDRIVRNIVARKGGKA